MNDYQFKYQTHTNHVFLNVLNLYTANSYHINIVDFKKDSDFVINLESFNPGKWYYHRLTNSIFFRHKSLGINICYMEQYFIPMGSKRIN